MFIDQITIPVKAGNGGHGVVRWRHEKFKPKAGPAGGNGGAGGDVYVRAVSDIMVLGRYVGVADLKAGSGNDGSAGSKAGRRGDDLYIDVPVGSLVTDKVHRRTVELLTVGEVVRMYKGGRGGIGNEYFKSSVNRAPTQATKGQVGESGELFITVSLVVDIGLIGLPNAGKSTLLNTLTGARSKVGAYAFTTTSAQLGDLDGLVIADIPGLIAGAAMGKGLGHTFLRHITRTKKLLHLISLETTHVAKDYYTIETELSKYQKSLESKEKWIILTKKDLVEEAYIESVLKTIDVYKKRVFVVSAKTGEGIKELRDALVKDGRQSYNG
jgi:GTP-binding protein